jgi:hypothetical protein
MRNLLIIFSALLVVFSTSCNENYLDTETLTEKTDGNYYSSPEECSEALVGCYDALQLIWSGGTAMPVAASIMSDVAFGSTGSGDGDGYPMLDEFDQSVSSGDLNMFEQNWIDYYKGIFRTNKLIQKIDNVDWTGKEDIRNQILGEARFLRAYFYFDLVRMFENIPLLEEESGENVPPADPDDTYTLITEDLLFAAGNTRNTVSASEHGHATISAAKSLLARVYLYYTGYYGQSDLVGMVSKSEALTYLEEVISESDHGLVDNYFDLWPAASTYQAAMNGDSISANTYAGEANQEIVFSIKYTYTSDYNGNTDGNHWMVINGIRGESVPKYGYGNGWGANTVVPEFYQDFDENDARRDASIMAVNEEGINYGQVKDVKEYTGYFTKKYVPTCDAEGNSLAVNNGAADFMIGQFQDYFVIRYSDVLLMAAELGSANAVDYVNQVRQRANPDASVLSSVNKDIIFEERRKEFAFEGIWYWDMLRYDSTLQYAANRVSYNGTVLDGNVETQKVIDGQNLINTRGLWQIPQNQITLSDGVLSQNTGWE